MPMPMQFIILRTRVHTKTYILCSQEAATLPLQTNQVLVRAVRYSSINIPKTKANRRIRQIHQRSVLLKTDETSGKPRELLSKTVRLIRHLVDSCHSLKATPTHKHSCSKCKLNTTKNNSSSNNYRINNNRKHLGNELSYRQAPEPLTLLFHNGSFKKIEKQQEVKLALTSMDMPSNNPKGIHKFKWHKSRQQVQKSKQGHQWHSKVSQVHNRQVTGTINQNLANLHSISNKEVIINTPNLTYI